MPRIKTTPRETLGTRLYHLLIGMSKTVTRTIFTYRGHQNILDNRILTLEKRTHELRNAHDALQKELAAELARLKYERAGKAAHHSEALGSETAGLQ